MKGDLHWGNTAVTVALMKRLIQHLNEPFSATSHMVGAMAVLLGTAWLLWLTWGSWGRVVSLLIYGSTTFAMFAASTLLHGIKPRPRLQFMLNRLDHVAIFLVIAGTYTPIAYTFFPSSWRWLMLSLVWLVALIGIGFKLLSRRIHGFLNATIYMILSWGAASPLFLAEDGWYWLPTSGLMLLLLGGAIYSVGFVVYYCRRPDPWPKRFGHHEIWHLFVLGGSLCHFLFMWRFVALGG